MPPCDICGLACETPSLGYCNACLSAIAAEVASRQGPASLWLSSPIDAGERDWEKLARGKSDEQIEAATALDPSASLSVPIYEALLYAEQGREGEAASKAAEFLLGNLPRGRTGNVYQNECASALRLLKRSMHFKASVEAVRSSKAP